MAAELRSHATEWEEAEWFPDEVFTRMAGLGLLGLKYPEDLGGQGDDHLHDALLCEELAGCASGGVAAGIGAHIGIATPPVWKFGTDEQKQRFLVARHPRRAGGRTRDHRARRRLRRGRHQDPGRAGGFYLVMANFQWERLLMALGAVGSMQRVIETTVAYALERNAFGREIGHFQAIRHKIAEMALKLEAGGSVTYNALRLFHEGHDAIREVTVAKLATQRAAFEVADDALQIHGGAGYMQAREDDPAGPPFARRSKRVTRDLRLGPIGGGTDEVMKEILAKQLGL